MVSPSFLRMLLTALLLGLLSTAAVRADSEVWTFRSNFQYDPWNVPIMDYLATIPQGQPVNVANIRAQIKAAKLAALKAQANGGRLVKSKTLKTLLTDADKTNLRALLLPDNTTMQVAVFQTVAGYFDQFGLLAILQLVATWQCEANETCPQKVLQELSTLIAINGKVVQREVFTEIFGQPWIIATVSYEVPVGGELRVVPLRSRKLQVQEVP